MSPPGRKSPEASLESFSEYLRMLYLFIPTFKNKNLPVLAPSNWVRPALRFQIRNHPGGSFHLSSFCPRSHLRGRRWSARPVLITQRAAKTAGPDASGPSRSWRTSQAGAQRGAGHTSRSSGLANKRICWFPNTSHAHSGGAAHMWRDRQSFQVINPRLAG